MASGVGWDARGHATGEVYGGLCDRLAAGLGCMARVFQWSV